MSPSRKFGLVLLITSNLVGLGVAFVRSTGPRGLSHVGSASITKNELLVLHAGGRKKRRRRKEMPTNSAEEKPAAPETKDVTSDVSKTGTEEVKPPQIPDVAQFDQLPDEVKEGEVDKSLISEIAQFKFDGEIDSSGNTVDVSDSTDNTIPLPDIKEAKKQKELKEELARIQEQDLKRKKIKRSDNDALLKLLEQDPYADADDAFFEEEEYGTVSALLGERAKPFLGIPTGPLQVGHFIGVLVIILMAFIEYPGFPLTNLPSPLRGALQGGLGTVYAINLVLAVMAIFKAGERGQPAPLWFAKTFTVGGLAFDQLTQLPTTEQIEQAKARKGKRALNRK